MMKLAEALINRADAQKRVAQIRDRLTRSARIQEGDTPPEDPAEVLVELEHVLDEMTRLIRDINKTNAVTPFRADMSLTDALAERDRLRLERGVIADLVDAAAVSHGRFTRSEVKFLSAIDIRATQKRLDDLARQYRDLDSEIQALNWTTDLIES